MPPPHCLVLCFTERNCSSVQAIFTISKKGARILIPVRRIERNGPQLLDKYQKQVVKFLLMKQQLTAKLKLKTTPDQFALLRQTQLAYRDGLNMVSRSSFAHSKTSNALRLKPRDLS
jgi:hypothetical protein